MKITSIIIYIIAATSLLTVISCSPKISTNILMPAKSHEATTLKKLAVFSFEGNYGNHIRGEVESSIVNIKVKERNYFTVLDRAFIDKVMAEQSLQSSGLTDPNTNIKLGKVIGADGLVTGSAFFTEQMDSYTEKRSKCSDKKCSSFIEYTVFCKKRTVSFNFNPKFISTATGEVVFSNAFSERESSSSCNGEGTLDSREGLLSKTKSKVMKEFAQYIAPYESNIEIKMLDETDGIIDSVSKDMLKSGIKFAEAGRMDRACEIWQQHYPNNTKSISYNYNIGLCKEIDGNYNEALRFYSLSDKMLKEPNKIINKAIERIRTRLYEKEQLRKQM